MMCYVSDAEGKTIISHCEIADTYFRRLIGCLGKKHLEWDTGMLIEPCHSVHTCFMRFPIDVLFLDSDKKVIHIIENMLPWKFSPLVKYSKYVIELPAGKIRECGIDLSHQLAFSNIKK